MKNNNIIENRLEEILNTIKNTSNKKTNNFELSISYSKGTIGLEDHRVSHIILHVKNQFASSSISIISGADKNFGDIEIKNDYIDSYLNNKTLMKSHLNKILMKLNELTIIQKETNKSIEQIKSNKIKLQTIAQNGIGVLNSFINKSNYFLLLSPVNSDYLIHSRDGIFSFSGRRYNFGIGVRISNDGFEVELYGRPTNGIGRGVSFEKTKYSSEEVEKVIAKLEKYSKVKSIETLIKQNMNRRVIYS